MIDVIPLKSPLDFYKILKSIVKNYPATYTPGLNQQEIKCLRVNTFAVLSESRHLGNILGLINDLQSDNAGKGKRDINKDFFFSRHWANHRQNPSKLKFNYPLFGIAEGGYNFNISNVGAKNFQFNLMLVDWIGTSENACSSTYCSQRTKEEVGADLRRMLAMIIHTFSQFVFAEVIDKNGNIAHDWFSAAWLEQMQTAGEIRSFEPFVELSSYITTKNLSAEVFYNVFGSDGLIGAFTNINIQFSDCPPDWVIPFENAPISSVHDEGCTTC